MVGACDTGSDEEDGLRRRGWGGMVVDAFGRGNTYELLPHEAGSPFG